MSDWWLGGLLVVCFFAVVNSREDINSALTLAHCRASCINEINMSHVTQQRCRNSIECSQCWDMCRLLQSSSTTESFCMNDQCTGGCLNACRWFSTGLPPPTLITRPLEELTITGHVASWSSPASATPTPVYVVMVDHHQYLQTLDLTASLPLAVDPLTVQVLVVDWRGLTEVFTPRPQSPLEQTRTLVHRLGLEKTLDMSDSLNVSRKQIIVKKPWKLREVSRTYLLDLVKVHISWEPQQLAPATKITYLVTWQVEGGMIRGNLVTNTSSATLSLQLDTVFRIQVALFTLNSSDWESELIDIDTHRNTLEKSHLPSRSQPVLLLPSVKNSQMVTFLAGGVVTFLVVVLVLTWRWQHGIALRHSKLVNEEKGVPKLHRVFPPAVRLISDNLDGNVDLFSSRDNLLQN